jgi:hypothetical protein
VEEQLHEIGKRIKVYDAAGGGRGILQTHFEAAPLETGPKQAPLHRNSATSTQR